MSTRRNWARARSDAASAAEAFGDAVSIAGPALANGASERIDDARESLARAIEPHDAPRTRRLPWLIAALAVTALSVWGWRVMLSRRREDPGTPAPTTAPGEDDLFGKPVGPGPERDAGA